MIRTGFAVLALVLLGLWLFTWWQARVIGQSFPPTGAFVEIGEGARLHYTERRPEGEPRATIVLLHGASGNQADVMLPLGDRLAALGFRVIAPDRPGHGWSDRPGGAADAWPANQASILLEAFHTIGVDHAIVVGHSWSGALAAEFALDHPEFTDGLVLLSPVLYPWSTGVAWYYDPVTRPWLGPLFAHGAVMPLGLASLETGIAEVFAPQSPPVDFARRTGVYLLLRPGEFTANAQDVNDLLSFVTKQGPRMKAIAVPTAIVTGDGDRVVSPDIHARRAAQDIRGASLTVLHGVGHSPHWADPDSVVAAIVDVANRVRKRDAVGAKQQDSGAALLP